MPVCDRIQCLPDKRLCFRERRVSDDVGIEPCFCDFQEIKGARLSEAPVNQIRAPDAEPGFEQDLRQVSLSTGRLPNGVAEMLFAEKCL